MWLLALLALLAAAEKELARKPGDPNPANFTVRASPPVNMAPASTLVIFAEHKGLLVESEYCVGVEVEYRNGQKSGHFQDCPPFAEYVEQLAHHEECTSRVVVCPPGFECSYNCKEPFRLQRSWVWRPAESRLGFGPGEHNVPVTFFLPNGKKIVRYAHFLVAGAE
jgi:hypothetical protein